MSNQIDTFRDYINEGQDTTADFRYAEVDDNYNSQHNFIDISEKTIRANETQKELLVMDEAKLLEELPGLKHLQDIHKAILRDEFSWDIIEGKFPEIREVTKFENLTIKRQPRVFPWLLSKPEFYRKYITLDMIKAIVGKPYYLFGNPVYDQTLRVQCDLIQIFMVFHLKHDFRFHNTIDAEKFNIIEPFSRIQTRHVNTKDQALRGKYFSQDFNLKTFMMNLFTDYFPNVSWRYIGGEHIAHRLTFQLCEYIFQIGLWTAHDVDELAKNFLEKSENLTTLENCCIKDIQATTLSAAFANSVSIMFQEIREYMSLSVLHMIILLNDDSLKKSVSFSNRKQQRRKWGGAYYTALKENNTLNQITMKYLMNSVKLQRGTEEKVYPLINKLVTENIDKILMLISDQESDTFYSGMHLSQTSQIEYYFVNFSNKSSILKKAKEITDSLKSLIDNIMTLNGFTIEGINQGMEAENAIEAALRQIYSFLNEGKQKGDFYHRQMALCENNIILVLLTLITMIISFKNVKQNKNSIVLNEAVKRLANICEDNFSTQSSLFQGVSGKLFNMVCREDSMLGIMALRFIFEKNNTILYVGPDVFESIIIMYKEQLDNLFNIPDLDGAMSINNLLPEDGGEYYDPYNEPQKRLRAVQALYSYNTFIEKVITLHKISEVQKRSYDLEVQSIIAPHLQKHIFPLLQNEENWKGPYGDIALGSVLRLGNESMNSSFFVEGGEVFSILQNDRCEKETVRNALFELCYSFVKIFNKMSKRMVYVDTYERVSQFTVNFDNYFYLTKFNEGVETLSEIIKFFNNYKIFYQDRLIGLNRTDYTKQASVIFLEKMVPNSHMKADIPSYFEKIFECLSLFQDQYAGGDYRFQYLVKTIVYKGLLVGLYKYLKGCGILIFSDPKLKTNDEIIQLNSQVVRIFDSVRQNLALIQKFTDGQFVGQTSIEKFTITKPESYRERDMMELDERLQPEYYNMRIASAIIVKAIELSMPENIQYSIQNFKRDCVDLKPKNLDLYFTDQVSSKKIVYSAENQNKGQIQLEQSVFFEVKEVKKPTSLASKSYFSEYKKLRAKYIEEKKECLNKRGIQNILIYYFDENKEHIHTVIQHCILSIRKGLMSDKPEPDIILKNFFKYEFIYPYIQFLSVLFNSYGIAREVFYCMICKAPDAKQKKNVDSFMSKIKDNNLYKSEYEETLSLIFFLSISLRQYLQFKSFIDSEWESNFKIYCNLTDLFKNCCENNSIFFKEYLSTFKPVMPSVGEGKLEVNSSARDWDYLFDSYVRIESFQNASLSWFNQSNKIQSFDRPELFRIIIRNFAILNEMLNGPCNVNQRKIYRYRTDIYMGLVVRIIDNVNSQFYEYKSAVIDFLTSLTEGEGYVEVGPKAIASGLESRDPYLTTKFFASNFTPKLIFDTIYKMLKRLALFIKFKQNPSYRKTLVAKVAEQEIEKVKKLNGGKIDTADRNYIYDKYGVPRSILSSAKPVDANDFPIITQEMCDHHTFNSYTELIDMYQSDEVFPDHIILAICMKLYSFLESLGQKNVSSAFNLFIQDKKNELFTYYGNEVDLDDRAADILKSRPKKEVLPITEDLVFFMFILKISRKIEISVKLPNAEEAVTKSVYFRRIPQTFFLENKVKQNFLDRVELESKKHDFIKNVKLFITEMENNFRVYRTNHFLYYITKADTFDALKIMMWIWGVIINIFCLIGYELGDPVDGEGKSSRRLELSDSYYSIVIIVLSAVFALSTFLIFFIWIISRFPLIILAKIELFKIENPHVNAYRPKNIARIVVYDSFLSQAAPLNFYLHFIFAILGIFWNPFFHTLHLILIVNISKTAQYVVKAVFIHIDQIFVTFIFSTFIIYSFSVLNADFYSDAFEDDSIDYCKTLVGCAVYSINIGLRNGGGIADNHSLYDYKDSKFETKTIFDLSFFIFINIIALNIVFGIIIDTFGEMRGDIALRKSSLSESCFICSIKEKVFRENGVNYTYHTRVTHEIWLYVYYLMYIKSKDPMDFNGDEVSVWEAFTNKDDSFMPSFKALELKVKNQFHNNIGL